jgi:hypothetical protein
MFEWSYTLDGKPQRINASYRNEVFRMVPEAKDVRRGHTITNAQLIETPKERGRVIDPGRASMC